jgi:hypothetical protein
MAQPHRIDIIARGAPRPTSLSAHSRRLLGVRLPCGGPAAACKRMPMGIQGCSNHTYVATSLAARLCKIGLATSHAENRLRLHRPAALAIDPGAT